MAGTAERQRQLRRFLAAVALTALLGIAQAAVPLLPSPKWGDLPVETRQILAPLAEDWEQLEPWRRAKWLEISQRYPKLSTDEQARVQERMRAWAILTPNQRKAAREQYRILQNATPEQKEALRKRWIEYEALPDEEKKRYHEEAARKHAAKVPANPPGSHSIVRTTPPAVKPVPIPLTPATDTATATAPPAAADPPADPAAPAAPPAR